MIHLGLIVEDQSDFDVVKVLAEKIARKRFASRKILSHGCGAIHSKARAWAGVLAAQGCTLLVVVCDLDDNRLAHHRANLQASLAPCPIANHSIVIPVREVEAWLLADHDAVGSALKLKKRVKKQANPEAIADPKKHLLRLVRERSGGGTTYLNTLHNRLIANDAKLTALRRCSSFLPFEAFVRRHLG